MATVLEVRGLTVRFGDRRVIDDLSFAVAEGESLAIIGPSGCGKTVFEALLDDRLASPPRRRLGSHGHMP